MTYIQKKRVKLIALAIGVLLLWVYLLGAMTSYAQSAKPLIEHGLKAVMSDDIEAFKALGTNDYASKITKDGFKKVVSAQQKNLKEGYKIEFMGTLKPRLKDRTLEVWKVSFTNDEPDLLIRIWTIENKCDGFWFHW